MVDIPKTWQIKKLGEVCKQYFSGTWGEDPGDRGNVFIVRVSDVEDEGVIDYDSLPLRYVENEKIAKYQLRNGDIVIVKSSGSKKKIISGKAAMFIADREKKILASNFVLAIRPDRKSVLPKWLLFCLNSDSAKQFVEKIIGITTYPNLKPQEYLKMQIPLPPIIEQLRIVKKIEELFEKIDKARKLKEEAIKETENFIPSALNQIFSRAKKEGWSREKLEDICIINPSKAEIKPLPDSLDVSFVPMSAVSEETGTIVSSEVRKLKEVRKGYTYFKERDILFAKITPCMENGKSAIAKNLKNGIGLGSTEFHVLRPSEKILAELIHFFIRQKAFREEAKRYFTGTAGQKRVPEEFLKNATIWVPPIKEQHRIVKYLDSLQSKVGSLKKLQAETQKEMEDLKKSILDRAFKGELV